MSLDQQIIWNELASVDVDESAAFYKQLFGWTIREEERDTYLHFYIGDQTVAGLSALHGDQPPHWQVFVGTSDAEAYAARAKAAGGHAVTPLMDIPHTGRIQYWADPEGAVLAAFEPSSPDRDSWGNSGTPGHFCWVELMCDDSSQALSFYKRVVEWDVMPMAVGDVDYNLVLKKGGGQQDAAGGVMRKMEPGPSVWLPYVSVANVDASAQKAGDLGAQILQPPTDVGDFGRCAVFMDPGGAVLAIYQAKTC